MWVRDREGERRVCPREGEGGRSGKGDGGSGTTRQLNCTDLASTARFPKSTQPDLGMCAIIINRMPESSPLQVLAQHP